MVGAYQLVSPSLRHCSLLVCNAHTLILAHAIIAEGGEEAPAAAAATGPAGAAAGAAAAHKGAAPFRRQQTGDVTLLLFYQYVEPPWTAAQHEDALHFTAQAAQRSVSRHCLLKAERWFLPVAKESQLKRLPWRSTC
jgi:hypothetical protein